MTVQLKNVEVDLAFIRYRALKRKSHIILKWKLLNLSKYMRRRRKEDLVRNVDVANDGKGKILPKPGIETGTFRSSV